MTPKCCVIDEHTPTGSTGIAVASGWLCSPMPTTMVISGTSISDIEIWNLFWRSTFNKI